MPRRTASTTYGDLCFSLFLVVTASVALYLTRSLEVGTITNMSAGFVPRLLAWIQLAVAAPIVVLGFRPNEVPVEYRLRPIGLIAASLVFFAVSLETLGLVLTVAGTAAIASLAHPNSSIRSTLALSLFLAAFCYALFFWALGLSIPAWPVPGAS